jgi:glucokinase
MNLVVADIGGTKTLVALARRQGDSFRFAHRKRLSSSDYGSLSELLDHWLRTALTGVVEFDGIGLAVAGPVIGSGDAAMARATNLDWPILDAAGLRVRFGAPIVMVNDFAAIGTSLDALGPKGMVTLQSGSPDPDGLRLVVGAGTGLGTCIVGPPPEARLYAGEGGHADFSPADEWQSALGDWVRGSEGRCSREHLLSGPGIARIAAFMNREMADGLLKGALTAPDPAAEIGRLAGEGHPPALQVIHRFVSIYAGQLGDLALTALPRGGVFIAGGIAPRLLGHFHSADFLAAFRDKAPMQGLLENLPLHLIVHPEPGLLGAAVTAHRAVATAGEHP